MSEQIYACPWCGQELEPACEEHPVRIGLKKRMFYDMYLRCPNCGAQAPKVQSVMNQEEGLLAAAAAAEFRKPFLQAYDRACQAGTEPLDTEAESGILSAAQEGRVSVWPVKPGDVYYKLDVGGSNAYDQDDNLIGQKIRVNLLRRTFRVSSPPWGPSEFATKEEALEAIAKRWPGIKMEEAEETHKIRTRTGLDAEARVPNGQYTGETLDTNVPQGLTREDIEGPTEPEEQNENAD